MYKIGENEMVLCPYNRSHVVSKLRIQKHIVKCKSRYPEVNLITCFYNYTHRLRPEDVLKHYEICSQKIRMEEARYCKSQYDVCKKSEVFDLGDNDKASSFSNHKTNSEKGSVKDFENVRYNSKASEVLSVCKKEPLKVTSKDDAADDLKPLNLPKTVSKAFTIVKQQTEKSNLVPTSKPVSSQSSGFGRGRNFVIAPERTQRANDRLLQGVTDMDMSRPKTPKSKYFLNDTSDIGNSCSASVISSLFDDGVTQKSDEITFDDDDNESFMFKNIDKYVKI